MLQSPDTVTKEPQVVREFRVPANMVDFGVRSGETAIFQEWTNGVVTRPDESPTELREDIDNALVGLRARGVTPDQMAAFSAAYNTDTETPPTSPAGQRVLGRIEADEDLHLVLEQQRRIDALGMSDRSPVWASLGDKKGY